MRGAALPQQEPPPGSSNPSASRDRPPSVPPPPTARAGQPLSTPRPAPAAEPGARAAAEAADRRELIGQVVGGKYRVRTVIGEGGMGSVFEAEHLQIGRLVAVKVLHPKEAQKPEAVSRLEHEARIAGRIGHPNICEVYDIGRLADDSPYLVMERLHGETLAQRIQRAGPVSPYEAVDIMLQVLSALVAAHDQDVVHRDLKPENIFLSQRAGMLPVAKILDFGISKLVGVEDTAMDLTQPGMVMGTPYYMAPEQARGDRQIDRRVDLWAAGVILYESLTGQRPFVARNYNALLVQILTVWHRPVTELAPGVSSRLSKIVDRALAKAREDRFQTATEFLDQVRRFKRRLSSSSVPAQKQPPSRPDPPKIRVHEIHDEGTDDGTIVFARVKGSREIVVAPVDANGRPIAPQSMQSAPATPRATPQATPQATPPVTPRAAPPVAPQATPPAPEVAAPPTPRVPRPPAAPPAPAPPVRVAPPAPPRPPAPRAVASPQASPSPPASVPRPAGPPAAPPRPAPPRPAAGAPASAPRPGAPPPSTRFGGAPPPSTRSGGAPPTPRPGAAPRYGYVDDPTTVPIDGSDPLQDDDSEDAPTMVDPPSFIEDSVTAVRNDPRPRRDRG